MKSPTPEAIVRLRKRYGHTQAAFAQLIYKSPRQWRRYEAGDCELSPAEWELLWLKANKKIPTSGIVP